MRSVALFHNEGKPEARAARSALCALLRRRGVRVEPAGQSLPPRARSCDIAVAVGGDGTMLRAARLVAPHSIPLLGLNTGGLGFLAAVDLAGFQRALGRILAGGFRATERWMLSVEVRRGAHQRGVFGPTTALNDCVIRCGDQARAMTLQAYAAGQYVADFFGDGLILSTPTGSTAYALAVGGPVVDPGLGVFLLAPICPHSLAQRPLILPAGDPVEVRLTRRNPTDRPQALVSLDGQRHRRLAVGDSVHIRRFERPLRLLSDPERSYFELLRQKLKWAGR